MKETRFRKLVAALAVGTFAITIPMHSDARLTTKSERRSHITEDRASNVDTVKEITPHIILNPNADIEVIRLPDVDFDNGIFEESNVEEPYSGSFYVPKTISLYDTSIIGTPLATQEQCVSYLLEHNPYPNLPITAEEIVQIYYEEGEREGIRPDVAFAQALKETGFFRYGGDVVPEQNNYCGLGTTGGGVRGEYFPTPQMGVRAHIQHLLAYSSSRKPTTPIIDPRYDIVRKTYGSLTLHEWQDLNGRWAVPGNNYGQEILSMFKAILFQ